MSLRYSFPEQSFGSVTLFANVNNLGDEIDVRYLGTPATPNQIERYGRYYSAGVRMDF